MYYQFNSISEFSGYLNAAKLNSYFSKPNVYKNWLDNDASFRGTSSYDEANELLLNGDHANADKIRQVEAIQTDHTQVSGKRYKPATGLRGRSVHVGRYLAGRPDCMRQTRIEPKKQKVITVALNMCAPASLDSKKITSAAANLVSVIRAIESGGTRVELSVIIGGYYSDKEFYLATVKIKSAAEYLNTEKFGYPLLNPSMLRRHSFHLAATCPDCANDNWSGMGYPYKDAEAKAKLEKENQGQKYDVITGVVSLQGKTIEEIKSLFTEK